MLTVMCPLTYAPTSDFGDLSYDVTQDVYIKILVEFRLITASC